MRSTSNVNIGEVARFSFTKSNETTGKKYEKFYKFSREKNHAQEKFYLKKYHEGEGDKM